MQDYVQAPNRKFRFSNLNFRLPTVESILEIMISKADPKAKIVLRDSPICLINDLNSYMSGQTISYLELC